MHKDFAHQVTVYSDDTDCYGIVYHANYLHYMDHARTEWVQQKFDRNLAQLLEADCQFVIYSVSLQYHKPARLADRLLVSCNLIEYSRSSLSFHQVVGNYQETKFIYCSANIKLACVTREGKVRTLPDLISNRLK